MMEGGLLDGDQRDRQRFLEAKRAKGELLSGADLRESIKAEAEVKPYVVKKSASKGNHKRKKYGFKS